VGASRTETTRREASQGAERSIYETGLAPEQLVRRTEAVADRLSPLIIVRLIIVRP